MFGTAPFHAGIFDDVRKDNVPPVFADRATCGLCMYKAEILRMFIYDLQIWASAPE